MRQQGSRGPGISKAAPYDTFKSRTKLVVPSIGLQVSIAQPTCSDSLDNPRGIVRDGLSLVRLLADAIRESAIGDAYAPCINHTHNLWSGYAEVIRSYMNASTALSTSVTS